MDKKRRKPPANTGKISKNTHSGNRSGKNTAKRNLPTIIDGNTENHSISVGGQVPRPVSAVSRGKKKSVRNMHAARRPNIITVRKNERTPFPLAPICVSILITILILFMVMNYAEINKYRNQIASLETKVTDLKKEENTLSHKLDKKDDLVYIEEYVNKNLNMVKKENLPRHYVNLLPEDKAEIIKYDDGNEYGVGVLLSGMGDIVKSFFTK